MKSPSSSAQSAICLAILVMCIVIMLLLSAPAKQEQSALNTPIPPLLPSVLCSNIATGNRLGTYYPAGLVIAKRFNEVFADKKQIFRAIETNGAIENIRLLKTGGAILGMAESRLLNESALNSGDELRLVWPLWHDVVHIIKANDKFNPGASFPGRLNVFLGQKGSSTRRTAGEIMSALGVHTAKQCKEIEPSEAALAIHSGNIGYALIQSGLPNNAVSDALAFKDCSLYGFSSEEIKKILLKVSTSVEFEIPSGYYADEQPIIKTIAMPNMLVAPKSVPSEQIEALLEAMLSSLSELKLKHKALGSITTEPVDALRLMSSVKLPIHEGALSWLKKHKATARGSKE